MRSLIRHPARVQELLRNKFLSFNDELSSLTRFIAMDLPGHGFSDHTGRYDFYQFAGDVLAFLIAINAVTDKSSIRLKYS